MVRAHPWEGIHNIQQGFHHSDLSTVISAVMMVRFEGWGSHCCPPSVKTPKHHTHSDFPDKHAI